MIGSDNFINQQEIAEEQGITDETNGENSYSSPIPSISLPLHLDILALMAEVKRSEAHHPLSDSRAAANILIQISRKPPVVIFPELISKSDVKRLEGELRARQFSTEQVSQIASPTGGGGPRNLAMIICNYQTLINLGFNNEQMTRMVSHKDGIYNIAAAIEHHDALMSYNLNNDLIASLVGTQRGTAKLKSILNLLREGKITNQAIPDMLSRRRAGLDTLTKLAKKEPIHTEKKQAVVAAKPSFVVSFNRTNKEDSVRDELLNRQFSEAQVDKIFSYQGAKRAATAIIEHYDTLIGLGFRHDQIVDIVSYHNKGDDKLRAALEHCYTLIGADYKLDDCVKKAIKLVTHRKTKFQAQEDPEVKAPPSKKQRFW